MVSVTQNTKNAVVQELTWNLVEKYIWYGLPPQVPLLWLVPYISA